MARLDEYPMTEERKRKAIMHAAGSGDAYVLFYDHVLTDESWVTFFAMSVGFRNRDDMFHQLRKMIERSDSSVGFQELRVETLNSKVDTALTEDAKNYLLVWEEELKATRYFLNRGIKERLSEAFGLSVKPVSPSENLEVHKSGKVGHYHDEHYYTDRKTGRRFDTRDNILAAAMARNLIAAPV